MKKIFLIVNFLITVSAFAQPGGYEIKVSFKPFKNQYIYLGHYFGKTYPIIDSAMLNDKSEAVFKGNKNLPGGIYLIGYPNKAGFFEILIDKQQKFSVLADTINIVKGAKFINSKDNELFVRYQQFMNARGKQINALQKKLKEAETIKEKAKTNEELTKIDKSVTAFREDMIAKNPTSLLTVLLKSMREPQLTGKLTNPTNKEDSLAAYRYYKNHFWDGVNFYDGRLAYTPFFEDKLDKYYNQLVVPQPDSIIREIDYMLSYASASEEMNRFLLIKFINRYLNQKYMWEDAIFVHLFEKYFANKTYSWLNDKGRKTITDRAYSLMANIMGTPAADILLPDTAGKLTALYEVPATYTIVAFWDPACGHCKEVLPKLDSFYINKWKAAGLQLFSVAKENEGTKKDWLNFIHEYNLQGWTHVYYSKADDKLRTDASVPGYSQLYDVQSFPTLYLLDKDKRIIAKKLTYQQIDEVLQVKLSEK